MNRTSDNPPAPPLQFFANEVDALADAAFRAQYDPAAVLARDDAYELLSGAKRERLIYMASKATR